MYTYNPYKSKPDPNSSHIPPNELSSFRMKPPRIAPQMAWGQGSEMAYRPRVVIVQYNHNIIPEIAETPEPTPVVAISASPVVILCPPIVWETGPTVLRGVRTTRNITIL